MTRRAAGREIVRAAISSGVERLFANEAGVRAGEDPEAVHQARVATRRLRSDLRTFRPLVDAAWADGLRDELGWLADLLGAVRDADVLGGRLAADAATLPDADWAAAQKLVAKQSAVRDAARVEALAGMASDRYAQLRARLADAATAPVFSDDEQAPVEDLMRRPWKHLKAAVAAVDGSPDSLHRVRIRAKRCRYAAEAVVPVAGKPARTLAGALADLQEVLGDNHDAVVAQAWLRSAVHRGPAAQAVVAGQLVALERRREEDTRKAWRAAWKRTKKRQARSA